MLKFLSPALRQFFIVTLLFIGISISGFAQERGTCSPTIGSIYGDPQSDEIGKSLAATPEKDGIYIAGFKDDSVVVMKISITGEVIWSRTFDFIQGEENHVSALIVDSEGMLVVSGMGGPYNFGGTVFVFRYNPYTHQMLWANRYHKPIRNYNFSLIEKEPGGNYIISNNPHDDNASNDFCELLELNRNTGAILTSWSKGYDLGGADQLTDLVVHEGFIYGTGRFSDGGTAGDMRNVLIKLDPNGGSVVWTKVGHVPNNQTARLYGSDLMIEQDQIYSCYTGDPVGTSVTTRKMYIQKTSLDGDLLWLKQYELEGLHDYPYQMIKSGDGIVILAGKRGTPAELILFKINLDGNIIWSKLFQFESVIASYLDRGISQIIELENQLIFTGFGEDQSGNADMLIVRTDLNGDINMPCASNHSITIPIQDVNNPVFYFVETEVYPSIPQVIPLDPQIIQSALEPRCIISDTITTNLEITICADETFEGYSQTGIYVDTFLTNEGCDSIRILNLTVISLVSFEIAIDICSGSSFEGYTQTGIYQDTFTTISGCDSIRTLNLNVISCLPIVHYNLEACTAYMHNGTNMDYTEFTPAYPNPLTCADVTANYVFRSNPQENKHSCTPGVNGSVAMCISSYNSCTYLAGHQASLVIEVTMNPHPDSSVRFTGLEFYEKAPVNYVWINGGSGPNNYPRRYSARILKNGTEIFREENISTTIDWTLESFDFLNNDEFRVEGNTLFRIELLPYCPVGNGAAVSAWDIDEIRIFGGCVPVQEIIPTIQGRVLTKEGYPSTNVEMEISQTPSFANSTKTITDSFGEYLFDHLDIGNSYFVKGFKNDDVLNGVSTLDIIHIQKHLLGISPFTSLHQFIAADVNHTGNVSAIDLLDMRKLILGVYSEFPRNTSWRFGAMGQDMEGSNITHFQEVNSIEYLEKDTHIVNFVGIKIGDLNGDVQLQGQSAEIKSRNANQLSLKIKDQELIPGLPFAIEIKAGDNFEMAGLQFAFDLGDMEIISVVGSKLNVTIDNYSFSQNGIFRFSWSGDEILNISSNDILFSILLISSKDKLKSNRVKLVNQTLKPEIYLENLETVELSLIFENSESISSEITFMRIEPNPVYSEADIHFYLPHAGSAEIRFFDLSGRIIHVIERDFNRGNNSVKIKTNDFPLMKGIIYCQLISKDYTDVDKFIKLN